MSCFFDSQCSSKLAGNYTVSQKRQDTKLLPITCQILTDFQTFFTDGLGCKFATNSCLNIPPRLKRVATQPCEIWKSEKLSHAEICFVINDKSQGRIARHLRNDDLLYYTFIAQSSSERTLKIGEHLAKLQAKWWLCQAPNSHCTFVLKDAGLSR